MDRKQSYLIGLDVGSTTVKAVVTDAVSDRIVWSDYQRHDTKQPEKVLEFLKRFEREIAGFQANECRIFITGSGGNGLAGYLGAKFVQEVNAVSLAVEKLHPECGSVIELGGQDAKIIIFKKDPETGRKKKLPSMNDKCAGGTGAVIDKINAKLRIPSEQLCQMGYEGLRLHPVAGKCGVFAETDINGLQKAGVATDELMASLFEAIVMQNLSVLTRGNTLRPVVLLLGGPNTYIRGMKECWKHNIPKIWKERNFPLPEGVPPEDLIRTPDNAQYFAAIGAVEFGKSEEDCVGCYKGWERLEWYVEHGRDEEKAKKAGSGGLAASTEELEQFKSRYRHRKHEPAQFQPGETVEGFIGLDGGSTSTKAVLVSKDKSRSILLTAYALSKGNPIEDTIEILGKLETQVAEQGAALKVLGVGTTGYAKDILKDVIGADAAIVETVAHTEAGLHFYRNVDVICDVGGQDIKIIILKNGRVKDFKLNTQCSAGNGYFLQSTAQGFGFPVEQFADVAFGAEGFPSFGYGCAVFMQSDIVDFQRQGWKPEEIMAGLCNVLPKNIWLYVSQIPNLSAIGTRFLLQGGTQYNLAAVKTQVDFIESRFKGKDTRPEVIVHQYCGEAGAIGAALEAGRLYDRGRSTSFIGLPAVREISFKTTRTEATRCYFCKNNCLRTFIDVKTPLISAIQPVNSKVPLEAGAQRLIIATCEKGTVEDVDHMRSIKGEIDRIKEANPNFAEIAARAAFRVPNVPNVSGQPPRFLLTPAQKRRSELMKKRAQIRIGMPRVLNMYSSAPLFRLPRSPAAELGVLGFHHRGALQGRRQARCHRSLFPLETRNSAHTQPAQHAPRQEAARLHLLPGHRRSNERLELRRGTPFLPDRCGDAGSREGGLHQRGRRLQGERRRLPGHVREPGEPGAARAADVRAIQGHPRPFSRRERPRRGARLPDAGRLQPQPAQAGPRGARPARTRGPHRRGHAGASLSQRSWRQPRHPRRVPEDRLPGLHPGFAAHR
jgi:activator of 2-hydroxyglutaryl-CoA dehydratase